jgi:hypothetical protein
MKKIVRDVAVVLALFAVVLVAPLVLEDFTAPDSKQQLPVIKTASDVPEPTATKAPPMPEPENNAGGDYPVTRPDVTDVIPAPAFRPVDDDGCSLAGIGNYSASTSGILSRKGDMIVVGGTSEEANVITGTIDGGGGIDKLEVHGAGVVNIDGASLINVEVVIVRNGVANEVNVLSAGLTKLDGGHAVIDGDSSDKVVLPTCLTWSADPVPMVIGDVNYLRYDATDAQGNKASVSVSSEIEVVKP